MFTRTKFELLALTGWTRPKRKRSPPDQPTGWISRFYFPWLRLIALTLAFTATSYGEVLPFKKYTTSDGLAQDRVGRIVRDSRGFLWFCTGEGLSRFDGYQFKNYTRDNGLPHRSVSDLLETRDGRYWLATGAGLVLFNPSGVSRPWSGNETEEAARDPSLMFRVFQPVDAEPGKRALSFNQIIEDRKGNIWGAANGGIFVLDRGDPNARLRRVDKEAWRGKYNEFTAVLEDNSGALWLNSVVGLYRLLPDGSVQWINGGVSSLSKDKKGNIWGGNQEFTCAGLEQPKLAREYTEKDGLINRNFNYAFLESADGTIWLGSIHGLSRSAGRSADGRLQFQPVSDFVVQSLGEDSAGNIWIGTESSGTYRLSRSGFRSFEKQDGLKTLRGLSITNGTDGNLYLVTNDAAVIHRFDGEKISAVSPLGMTPGSWGWNQYHFQDHAGEWWIVGGFGLQRYPKVKRLEDLAHTRPKRFYTVKDGLPDNLIFRVFEDSRGDIWIGTLGLSADNLARWDRATETFQIYTAKDGVPSGNGPTAFAEDSHGNIWIGYYSGSLIFRFRQGQFETPFGKDGLRAGLIRDIHSDSAGRLWIASAAGGVFRVDDPNADQPAIVNLTTTQGLSSSQATCITEDNLSRIYIGTARGVNRLDPGTGRIKVFTTADGLAENYVNACERDKSGALWFGFFRGLSRLVPEPDVQHQSPSIFIANVLVNGVASRKLSELGETAVHNLELLPDQRQIRIEFFALGFAPGEMLRYQYRFVNSNDWSEPTVERTVNLNLSPGSYRFLVRAVNADGLTSEQPAAVSFTILRPVWQRWWFVTLALLTMTGIVYALYRFRLAQLLKVERVRTRIATDLHDDIGASLSRMAILSEVVKQQTVGGNGKQAAPLLTEIADSARGLVDSMGDIVWSIDPRRDDLQSVVRRIRQFASDVLEAKGIEWELQVPPEVERLKLSAEQRQHLFLIFKEGINNVVRHGKTTKSVSLSIRTEARDLIGQISDDGCGFTPQGPDQARSQGRGGNGLPNMRERAGQLGGRLEITAAPGAGTKLTLRTPIK